MSFFSIACHPCDLQVDRLSVTIKKLPLKLWGSIKICRHRGNMLDTQRTSCTPHGHITMIWRLTRMLWVAGRLEISEYSPLHTCSTICALTHVDIKLIPCIYSTYG